MLCGVQVPGDSMKAIKGTAAKGMILPFEPMALTFDKISYYVPFPKVAPTAQLCVQHYSVFREVMQPGFVQPVKLRLI